MLEMGQPFCAHEVRSACEGRLGRGIKRAWVADDIWSHTQALDYLSSDFSLHEKNNQPHPQQIVVCVCVCAFLIVGCNARRYRHRAS